MKKEIKSFVIEEILRKESDFQLDDRADLLKNGLIDSMGIVRLISFIKDTFGIKVAPEEMVIENFESIQRLSEFIRSKQ